MFQHFDSVSDPSQAAERVARLRALMKELGIDGFLVPRADEHQGEYVSRRAERLQWLTGFTGSAGMALILADKALVFVDGRYQLQVREQVDLSIFTIESLIDTPPRVWLSENARPDMKIGFDPWLHTLGEVHALHHTLARKGVELVALHENPVDAIWEDQPAPPCEPAFVQPLEYAGEEASAKLARLSESIANDGADCAMLTDPSSLAWTFNIRGNDVPHTPLALGFALICVDGRHVVFMDERKLKGEVGDHVRKLARVMPPEELENELAARAKEGATVALDPSLAAEKLRMIVAENGGTVVQEPDPARLPRATKNRTELDGARAAHRRDGAAVTKFLAWLDRQEPGTLDEIAAATWLEECRRVVGEETQQKLRDVSFDTISGAGPNGAIMHYRVTTKTNRKLKPGELYLVDSGAQYLDGTTDITRTVPVGTPSDEMRERYTIVLKGLIAISLARFPLGTRGCDLDPLARIAHWKAGLDFAHGTGHGIGAYLAVHEGPQRIAKTGTQRLEPGMILSNEPGYYKEGHYGIRLENLIVVRPADAIAGGDLPMHGFETLTLAPFDRRLVKPAMLSPEERGWLDAYHARVLAEIGPMLDGEALAWLEKAAAPLP